MRVKSGARFRSSLLSGCSRVRAWTRSRQVTEDTTMYKTLLVPVDGRPRSSRSLEYAGRLARVFGSHVVGLFVKPVPYIPSAVYASGGARLLEELRAKIDTEAVAAARAQFDAGAKAANLERAEWRVGEGDVASAVALHARYADLVVINQTDPGAEEATQFADAVVMDLGRPALIVPYTGKIETVGRNVLVCWNASGESARAVTDALPLLTRAERVTVMTVDATPTPTGHGESPGADVALYLARHGVKAESAAVPSGGIDVGNLILSRAYDLGADLIVMGAYGHTRMREFVFGGATRTLLQSMTVPVLMSH
jgi:nucleotide-binding universal stress UspA family protein